MIKSIKYTGTELNKKNIKKFLNKCLHFYKNNQLLIPHTNGILYLDISDYLIMEYDGSIKGISKLKFQEIYR